MNQNEIRKRIKKGLSVEQILNKCNSDLKACELIYAYSQEYVDKYGYELMYELVNGSNKKEDKDLSDLLDFKTKGAINYRNVYIGDGNYNIDIVEDEFEKDIENILYYIAKVVKYSKKMLFKDKNSVEYIYAEIYTKNIKKILSK